MNIKRVVTTIERSWTHAYLDDDMGTLMITSDWGDWSHRWGLSGMPKGVAFSDFIFGDRNDFNYVARKLYSGRRDDVEWDEKATKRELRKRVARGFRSGEFGPNTCTELMHEIDAAETFEELYYSELLVVYADDRYSKPTWSFLHLRDVILPALQRAYIEQYRQGATP
jgi:hypothetical protein